jgi:hypothetical protein
MKFTENLSKAYGEEYFNGRKEIMRTYMTTGCSDLSPVIQVYQRNCFVANILLKLSIQAESWVTCFKSHAFINSRNTKLKNYYS